MILDIIRDQPGTYFNMPNKRLSICQSIKLGSCLWRGILEMRMISYTTFLNILSSSHSMVIYLLLLFLLFYKDNPIPILFHFKPEPEFQDNLFQQVIQTLILKKKDLEQRILTFHQENVSSSSNFTTLKGEKRKWGTIAGFEFALSTANLILPPQ